MGYQITEGHRNGTLSYLKETLPPKILYQITRCNGQLYDQDPDPLILMILQTINVLSMNFLQLSSCQ
jgi:hypothetical protein